jgi:hypothetical protein
MNKTFAIQHIWFNNQDAEVTLVGRMQDDVLFYESKLVIRMSQLNGLVSKLQKTLGIEVSDYMCRFELGFITEYEIKFPESAQVFLDLQEIIGLGKEAVRKIVA